MCFIFWDHSTWFCTPFLKMYYSISCWLVFLRFFYIVDTNLVPDVWLIKIFFSFSRLLLCLNVAVLFHTETLQLHGVPFINCFLIISVLLVFCLGGLFLCQWVQTYSLVSLRSGSGCLALSWGPWSTWSSVLCMVLSHFSTFLFFFSEMTFKIFLRILLWAQHFSTNP